MTENRRVALITGAATGIGRATAVALAAAGFDAVVNYSRSEQAARETARLAENHPQDLRFLGAKRHANAEFSGSPPHCLRHCAVETNGGQDER